MMTECHQLRAELSQSIGSRPYIANTHTRVCVIIRALDANNNAKLGNHMTLAVISYT